MDPYYGAFRPPSRPLVLVVASVSKAIFVGLILAQGSRYLGHARLAVTVDSLMVVVFIGYLIATRGRE